MQDIIYDVAVSVDGYISGPSQDIARFPHTGPIVDTYLARLPSYAAVIMGRGTYQFGLDMGMPPGSNPYPIPRAIVISDSLCLPETSAVEQWRGDPTARVKALRANASGPIYLCGGGALAAWMLERGLIARLRLKRAPILLGAGTRLFERPACAPLTEHVQTVPYPDGTFYQELRILPG
jgi:dihydrofolate reductase